MKKITFALLSVLVLSLAAPVAAHADDDYHGMGDSWVGATVTADRNDGWSNGNWATFTGPND
ncbi:hypothetical protein ACIOYT_30450 [Streptomyces halstedii]|uniref:hypothetical protein n=1 Tax=Streptomyces halstedii TaxID=1944 RepID=UPI0038264296